jgi:hypothetical protein
MPFVNPPFNLYLGTTQPTATVYNKKREPFCAGSQLLIHSVGAAVTYGANHPGTLTTTKYAKFVSPGTITAYSRAAYATGIPAYDTTVSASLTPANYLYFQVLLNGVLQTRVGSDASPTGIQVQASDANTLTWGTAPPAGAIIEVFALVAADVIQFTGGTLVASESYNVLSTDFITNGTAALNAYALPRGN